MENEEKDWEYMKRVAPWACEAFDRIPRTREAMGLLFDTAATRWKGDDEVDLTNKTLFGLLQLEVEAIQESLEGLQPKKGWRLLFRAKDKILYQCDATLEVAEVPVGLADVMTRGIPYEGEVTPRGKYLQFSAGGMVVASIPRSLVLELRGPLSEAERSLGGGGEEDGERDKEGG